MSTDVLALRWGSVVAAGAAMILVGVLSVAFADAAEAWVLETAGPA